MSNAMRMGKRSLAGVAAGALGLGVLSFVGATSAQAGASGAATVTPVRVTYVGTVQDAVAPATLTMFGGSAMTAASDFTVDLLTSPVGGTLKVYDTTGDDTAVTIAADGTDVFIADDTLGISANVAGTYTGVIYNGVDTSTFAITTTGNPASMTLTPAASAVPVGGVQPVTVKIFDAAGNLTQPGTADTVKVEATSPGSPTSTTLSAEYISSALTDGSAAVNISMASSGVSTVAATPLGYLPSFGLTTQTATVTASGTVQGTPVKDMDVSSPANAINNLGTALTHASQVPAGTTSLKIAIDDDTGATSTAGANLLFQVTTSAGSVNGVSGDDLPAFVSATVGADESATLDLTLAAGAQVAGQYVTITQVQADGVSGVFPATSLTVTQKTPTVVAGDVSLSPAGTMVGKLGSPISVTVTVDDSFGTPQSGWTVSAYRGSATAANFLSSGVTGSAGTASVTVNNASTAVDGTSESYVFVADNNLGTSVEKSGLTVKWTASGDVTALETTPGDTATGATACSNTSCDITAAPLIVVPSDGLEDAAASTAIYTFATAASGTGATTVAEFPINATPTNASTVTTPEGVYVSDTLPSGADAIAWNDGVNTAVISGGNSAYIWATKTGTHDVTITSGGLTIIAKVRVANSAADAYNIAISPAKQSIAPGAFGTATVSVTDVFGNPVAGTSDDTGGVTVTATGEVRLGGTQSSQTVNTGTDGTATVTVIGGNTAGLGVLTATPTNATASSNAPAYRPTFVKPTGAPSPVLSATAEVEVTGTPPVDKALFITAYRSGASNVVVDGDSDGFERRDVVTLQTRTYNNKKGKWRPWKDRADVLIKSDGSFGGVISTTAKVRVRAISGDVKSNNLVVNK